MKNYDRVHPRKPEGIENRKAYIIGGGIAGLSAAAFLVRDGQMSGRNITVFDSLPVFGGSMDCELPAVLTLEWQKARYYAVWNYFGLKSSRVN